MNGAGIIAFVLKTSRRDISACKWRGGATPWRHPPHRTFGNFVLFHRQLSYKFNNKLTNDVPSSIHNNFTAWHSISDTLFGVFLIVVLPNLTCELVLVSIGFDIRCECACAHSLSTGNSPQTLSWRLSIVVCRRSIFLIYTICQGFFSVSVWRAIPSWFNNASRELKSLSGSSSIEFKQVAESASECAMSTSRLAPIGGGQTRSGRRHDPARLGLWLVCQSWQVLLISISHAIS